MRRGPSCLAHLQTRITSRCPATGLSRDWARFFHFHSLLHPSSTTCTAIVLAVACVFTNYQLCILSPKMHPAEGKSPARYDFTSSVSQMPGNNNYRRVPDCFTLFGWLFFWPSSTNFRMVVMTSGCMLEESLQSVTNIGSNWISHVHYLLMSNLKSNKVTFFSVMYKNER